MEIDRALLPGTWFYTDGAWEKKDSPDGWESPEAGYWFGAAPDLARWKNADSEPSRIAFNRMWLKDATA
jgi:hypothetical protein